MSSLSSFIKKYKEINPEKLAIVYQEDRISYSKFFEKIIIFACWLKSKEVKKGDIVAVIMKNSSRFLDIMFAVSHLGAVFLPLNYRLSYNEIKYIYNHAGAKILLADDEFNSNLKEIPNIFSIDQIYQTELYNSNSNYPFSISDLDLIPEKLDGDDLYRLMYTSGTTDYPKGVIHKYKNFYSKTIDQSKNLNLFEKDKLLIVGPMYHVGGIDLPGVAILWLGGSLVINREFSPELVLQTIEKEKITGVWFAPVMTNAILNFNERFDYDVSSLRWCIGGGEKTPESRIIEFNNFFPNARYIDAYGLTETVGGDTLMVPGKEIIKIGSVGKAIDNLEIEIRDEFGKPLGIRKEGEICLRGSKVTDGYWKDDQRTKASFYANKWFKTGDIGYLDNDQFLFLTDRKKDMIISGGENISSSEVERVIYLYEDILEVAVIGLPDQKWGEMVTAIVVPKKETKIESTAIINHCRKNIARFKVPKRIFFTEELPRNPSGKVLKRVLRETYYKK